MDRKERYAMIKEVREVVDEITSLSLKGILEDNSLDDDENSCILKMLKLSKKLVDYADFQAEQLDHIEDNICAIYGMIEKMQKKGAMLEC